MNIIPVFAVGVANVFRPDVLEDAKRLFDGRVPLSISQTGQLRTSLRGYDMGTNSMDIIAMYPETEKLSEAIKQEAKKFLTAIGANTDLYSVHVSNMWLNEMTSNNSSQEHYHYGHTLSGCYYVDLPANSAGITFINPLSQITKQTVIPNTITSFNSHHCVFQPKEGEMFLWESYLRHEVKPSEFEGVRRSIAFDVIIKYTDI